MKMKDFKAALKSKLAFAEKNLKVEDDFYLGYVTAMEDILTYLEGGEENDGFATENGSTRKEGFLKQTLLYTLD